MYNRYRAIAAILGISMTASVFCACNSGITSADPTLPTTESLDTSMTTFETSESSSVPTEITETTIDNRTYETAPESTEINTDFVQTMDGVTPEMMKADFWISENDNRLLMTDEEIAAFNHENRVHIKVNDDIYMPYFDEFEDTFDGDILREFLWANAASAPKDPSRYYLDGYRTSRVYWDNLIDLSNIDAVPDEIEVRYGFTVKRMTLRMYPTEDRVFDGPTDQLFDFNLYSECMPYMPCYILHESSDGEYYYVVFDSYASWVRKDAVALCSSKEDWLNRQNPEYWLTVTGREIRLGNDPYSEATSNLVLPMGTRMELVPDDDAPDVISERASYGDYIVKVPTRGSDGYINDEYVLIPVSDDVTFGYLPYTSENIVRQAMKLLGDRYGWGGDLQANDCTGITREIYRCFGILLPRVGQSGSKGVYKEDVTGMDEEDKLAIISELSPGSLISFPGHMMIYLGTVDGVPYVISAVGTFLKPEDGSNEVLHPRSVVINSLYVRRANLTTWLDSVTTVLTIKPE